MTGALEGIKVVDVTSARSGPTCTRQLADMGADVVRIERERRFTGGSDEWNLNRNKRSIVLDMKQPDDKEAFLRLIDDADVFVENWRPQVKHRLGLGPNELLARNPRLVYGSISGFGQDGPYGDRPGVDQIAQGMGGIMSVTGPPGTGPWRVGIAVCDVVAGSLLTQGVVAALFARERTGRGQWVTTSLLETAIALLDFQATRWLIDEVEPGQEGNSHPTFAGMGLFPTADGVINIAPIGDFDRFAEMIGRSDLIGDPRFATRSAQVENGDALRDEISAGLRRRTTDEWIDVLAEVIPAGPVYKVSEVFADAQVRHLDVTRTVETADGRAIDVLRHPVEFSDTPTSVRSGPPALGAHSAEVLGARAEQ